MNLSPSDQFLGKYQNSGRIGQFLIERFFMAARRLLHPVLGAAPRILEVGCGPGYSTERIKTWRRIGVFVAGEPEREMLEHAREFNPEIMFIRESAYALPHPDNSFDAVIMLEVLEHLDDPPAALAELHRISRGVVLISTPREPLWRALNFARGKYLGALGNTPGHIQHWSSRGLIRQVSPLFEVIACAKPVPWTILLLKPRKA